MHKGLPASLLVLVLASGCLQSASESRDVGEIRMVFLAEKTGDGMIHMSVKAYDTRSGLGWIDALPFSSGDTLFAISGEQKVPLHGGTGTLKSDAPTVTVSFLRENGQDAPNTVIPFPEPFALADIPSKVSRSQKLTVEWWPAASSSMTVEAKGSCIETLSEAVSPGSRAVSLDLRSKAESQGNESCDVVLTATRSRLGTVDKALWSSSKAFGREIRSKTFESIP